MAATPAAASTAEATAQAVTTVARQEVAAASADIQARYICSINFRNSYLVR
jgi:hypothetical protein